MHATKQNDKNKIQKYKCDKNLPIWSVHKHLQYLITSADEMK